MAFYCGMIRFFLFALFLFFQFLLPFQVSLMVTQKAILEVPRVVMGDTLIEHLLYGRLCALEYMAMTRS